MFQQPSTRRFHRIGALGLVAALTVSTAACGDDDDVSGDESGNESGDELTDDLADAIGAGGGGLLVFDGEEIPIDSVTCVSNGDDFSVGTVSDNDFRVFVDSSSTGVPNAQVLDADSNQWTPLDRGESIEIGDGTYSSPSTTYSDIRDSSREVEVSFTIECP